MYLYPCSWFVRRGSERGFSVNTYFLIAENRERNNLFPVICENQTLKCVSFMKSLFRIPVNREFSILISVNRARLSNRLRTHTHSRNHPKEVQGRSYVDKNQNLNKSLGPEL